MPSPKPTTHTPFPTPTGEILLTLSDDELAAIRRRYDLYLQSFITILECHKIQFDPSMHLDMQTGDVIRLGRTTPITTPKEQP